jgi:hypothetical protein
VANFVDFSKEFSWLTRLYGPLAYKLHYISKLRTKAVKIKSFIKSFNNIKPLVPTIIYSCLIYLYNSPPILFLEVIVSQYKCQLGIIVSYNKLGLYINNTALKALLFKILGNCRVKTRDFCIKRKL